MSARGWKYPADEAFEAPANLGYEYRPDGNFLCRVICLDCAEPFDVHAMANVRYRCPACEQVKVWLNDAQSDTA